MQCDNRCHQCQVEDENVNYAIFECLPALHAWILAATPTPPLMFTKVSQYTNMDYLFWQKMILRIQSQIKTNIVGLYDTFGKRETINYSEGYIGIHRKLFDTLSRNDMPSLNLTVNRKNQLEYNILNKQQSLRDVRKMDHAHDEIFSGYGWTWINSRGYTQLLRARNQRKRI